MKNIIVVSLVLWGASIMAQPAFRFSYDASGNRIKRELIDLSEDPEPDDPDNPDFIAGDDGEWDEVIEEGTVKQASALKGSSNSISVFPNPTSDIVYLQLAEFPEGSSGYYQVNSSSGKLIASSTEVQQKTEIDLSGQVAGYYILKVEVNGIRREWLIVKD